MSLTKGLLRPALLALLCALAPSARAEQVPVRGGTLVAVLVPTEPTSLSITTDTSGSTVVVSTKIFDGLVEIGTKGQILPGLAKSWEVSADGKRVAFHLRDGVKWHDGKPFTSADVKFSFDEIWTKISPRGRSSFASVSSVEAIDPLTVVFNLTNPSPVIFSVLNAGESQILPKHLYEGTEIARNPFNLKPIGTGPFRFKEWVRGDRIVLERNENYWDPQKPYLDGIVFRIIPDIAARAAAFETGAVAYGALSPVSTSDLERIRTNPNLAVDTAGYEWLGPRLGLEFNLRRPILQKPEVRHAIAHAIDLPTMARVVTRGMSKPATGVITSSQPQFYEPDTVRYAFDPKAAELLLDQAGLPRKDDGIRFRLMLDWLPFGENFMRYGEFVRQSLKKVGIDVQLRGQDLPRYFKQVYNDNDFDLSICLLNSFGDPQVGTTRLVWSKTILKGVPWTNASGYSDPDTDKIIEGINKSNDPAQRMGLIRDLQKKVQIDLPILILQEPLLFTVYAKRLQGVKTVGDGPYESLKNAWLSP